MAAISPEDARRAVEEVLSRPEYADLEPGLIERLISEALAALGALLERFGGTQTGTWAGVGILALFVVLGLVLLVRFLRGVRRDPAAAQTLGGPVGRSASDWEDLAVRHEAAGELREALRCRYRALVAALAAARVIEEVPGRTTGEYRSAVATAQPGADAAFSRCTAMFEAAWYGKQEVDPAMLEAFADFARAVREHATLVGATG